MRKIGLMVAVAALVVACGGGGGGGNLPNGGPTTNGCDNTSQKQFVLDAMNTWYLWNDLLPQNVNINDFSTPEALLAYLASFQPLDNFSFINSAEADQQFFGEGRFEGYGFSSRLLAADDLRLTRVFEDSPANRGGLARGQRILSANGRSIASISGNEGVSAFFGANATVDLLVREVNGTEFTTTISQDIVTIDPVPQWRIIDGPGGTKIGYFELATFISTADPVFQTMFGEFRDQNVNQIVIDLRYNGGGLVSTAELLGDYLGGLVAENLTFSRTEFNADRAAQNNDEEFFERQAESASLTDLVVIATRGTASASELVTNSMIPHVAVEIVGDRTFGKPVGQIGLEFCEKILRPTAFQTVNADGDGDYFDGLPVGAGCEAPDDLSVAVGADTDPNLVDALAWLENGACPMPVTTAGTQKPQPVAEELDRQSDRLRGPPHRALLDAY